MFLWWTMYFKFCFKNSNIIHVKSEKSRTEIKVYQFEFLVQCLTKNKYQNVAENNSYYVLNSIFIWKLQRIYFKTSYYSSENSYNFHALKSTFFIYRHYNDKSYTIVVIRHRLHSTWFHKHYDDKIFVESIHGKARSVMYLDFACIDVR